MFNKLLKAVSKNNVEKVRQLVAEGVDIEKRFDNNRTVLLLAMQKGKYEIAKFLIDVGANVNAMDHGESTALTHAVSNGNTEFIKILVEHGANIKYELKGGWTLLHLASIKGDCGVMTKLLEYGLDPEKKDDYGGVPLDYARKERESEIKAVIESFQQNKTLLAHIAAKDAYNDSEPDIHF